ncbi:MAG: hypothetical protein ACTSWG_13360 [Candidatus Helarchaeota archaeon]
MLFIKCPKCKREVLKSTLTKKGCIACDPYYHWNKLKKKKKL